MDEIFEICIANPNINNIMEQNVQIIRLILECSLDTLFQVINVIPTDINKTPGNIIIECQNFMTKNIVTKFQVLSEN